MFNKKLLQEYGAGAAVVKSALKAFSSFDRAEKLSLQRFNATLEAAQGFSELRVWFDDAKRAKAVHAETGAPLPDWYTFARDVTSIGRSWGAYLLQAQSLIDSGVSVKEYLSAEDKGRADIKRFIKWGKDGELPEPKPKNDAEGGAEGGAAEGGAEAPEGGAEGGAEGGDVIRIRARGCTIDIHPDGRVESFGPNVSSVLDSMFAAVAAAGLV